MENLYKIMREYGITASKSCEAIAHMPKIPFSEMDIVLIRSNPSLSWFQKWKLVREIKKNMLMN